VFLGLLIGAFVFFLVSIGSYYQKIGFYVSLAWLLGFGEFLNVKEH